MNISKKQAFLIAGGAVLAAAGIFAALNYPAKDGAAAAQGAIGQRQVYRDSSVTAGDVAVTPGAAPVANQTDLMKSQTAPTGDAAVNSAARSYSTASDAKANSAVRSYSTASDAKVNSAVRSYSTASDAKVNSAVRSYSTASDAKANSAVRSYSTASDAKANSAVKQQ